VASYRTACGSYGWWDAGWGPALPEGRSLNEMFTSWRQMSLFCALRDVSSRMLPVKFTGEVGRWQFGRGPLSRVD
jgi:hypothetical protein